MNEITSSWGGKFIVVYLPEWNRFNQTYSFAKFMHKKKIGNIINSIVWGDISSYDSIPYFPSIDIGNVENFLMINIIYSNIGGSTIWEGEGNINTDPLFVNIENGDFSLQDSSPCKNSGNPNLWYNDTDESRSDMGSTGGFNAFSNFISHDFGDVGPIGANIIWKLLNYRDTPITISSVSFGSSSFSTSTTFPMVIDPLEIGSIYIDCNPQDLGMITDSMIIESDDLPEGVVVELTLTSVETNILSGEISGTLPTDTYYINNDIYVEEGDTLHIQPGTEFIFAGGHWDEISASLIVNGVLKAIGTETDRSSRPSDRRECDLIHKFQSDSQSCYIYKL